MKNDKKITFYEIICILQKYWSKQNCIIMQPLDIPVGAGTFHYETFFGSIGKKPISSAYVQLCRRPTDSRFGKNPNRLQQYYQFQVIIKPAPKNIQEIYLNSLKKLNIHTNIHDIRFVEDNWENPTLGAQGVGWEVWLNGMEITQFTYFQQIGSLDCNPASVEITYGLERIAMYIQQVNSVYALIWNYKNKIEPVTYGELFYQSEIEKTLYNIEYANTKLLLNHFHQHLSEAKRLLLLNPTLLLPAYEHTLEATHNFNLLDSRKAMSNIERQNYILKIRNTTKNIAQKYFDKISKIELS